VGPELLLLIIALIVVLVWRGPSTLPRLGEAAGKAVTSVRQGLRSKGQEPGPDEREDQPPRTDH
jgi:Sec-independent protein translocase protein TatA